jgi:hypothetical protein
MASARGRQRRAFRVAPCRDMGDKTSPRRMRFAALGQHRARIEQRAHALFEILRMGEGDAESDWPQAEPRPSARL